MTPMEPRAIIALALIVIVGCFLLNRQEAVSRAGSAILSTVAMLVALAGVLAVGYLALLIMAGA